MTSVESWATFARQFHGLARAPGVQPGRVDQFVFDAWAAEQEPYDGVREAAQFVLHLWNSSQPWECGPFVLRRAIESWDAEHQAVFAAWAANPRAW